MLSFTVEFLHSKLMTERERAIDIQSVLKIAHRSLTKQNASDQQPTYVATLAFMQLWYLPLKIMNCQAEVTQYHQIYCEVQQPQKGKHIIVFGAASTPLPIFSPLQPSGLRALSRDLF